MAKQNKKKQERKLAAREKHKNNSKSQENDSTDDPDLEKQLDRINLKLSYGFHDSPRFTGGVLINFAKRSVPGPLIRM